jgi:hypothetical protein
MDLKQTNDVFANPHTENLHDRQLAVLRRLVEQYHQGFRYSQLDDVCQLLTHVWARVASGAPQFVPQLQELIGLCGLPIIRDRSNEEFLGGLESFEHLVSTLEQFLHVPSITIQIATCEALREISLGHDILRTNNPPVMRVLGATHAIKEDLRPLPRELHQGLLLKGGVVAGLALEIQNQVNALSAMMSADDAAGGGGSSNFMQSLRVGSTDHSSSESSVQPGYLKTTVTDVSDDEEEEGDTNGTTGGGGGGMVVEVAVKTRALKAELVSSIPKATRALIASLMDLLREISGDAVINGIWRQRKESSRTHTLLLKHVHICSNDNLFCLIYSLFPSSHLSLLHLF